MRAAGEEERNSDIPPRRAASLGRVLACLVLCSTPSTERRTQHQICTGPVWMEETLPYLMRLALWKVFVWEG